MQSPDFPQLPLASRLFAATAGTTGPAFFAAMARSLAENLGTRWAFLGELVGPGRMRSLAGFGDGKPMPVFEYDLAGTPCEEVLSMRACAYPRDVADLFPGDAMLGDMGIASYFGIPVPGSDGKSLGILVALHDAPKFDCEDHATLLELFALRVGAELERVRMQTQLLHTQKLESLGLLAGGIAHDFNNLLVGIVGNVELALAKAVDAEQHTLLRSALGASHSAADLTRQLLIYAGRTERHTEVLALEPLVRETVQMLAHLLGKRSNLTVQASADLPPVAGDPAQLRQIVMNLVTNANEALQGQTGRVDVSITLATAHSPQFAACRIRAADFAPGAPHLALRVADTGIGMSPETLARVFDPFFTTKPTGRGLGMAAMLGILHTHHGAIAIDTEPGCGTAVTVFLPASDAPCSQAQTAAPSANRKRFQGERILVVDDDPMVMATIVRVLTGFGCAVVEATLGEAAVRLLADPAQTFAAAIIDQSMPAMSGSEVVLTVRSRGVRTPILLTTGRASDAQIATLPADAITGVLHKPWTVDQLATALASTLQRH